MTEALISIASRQLSAQINLFGAELHALQDSQGRELLWDGDPAVWTDRAPVLFPIVGALNSGQYRWQGRSYPLPKHGFARRSQFAVVDSDESFARLRLEASAGTRAVYPFDFRLDLSFACQGPVLRMTADVTNMGEAFMPAAFGFHPALRWPLPGEVRSEARIVFDAEEAMDVHRLDDAGLIDPRVGPSPIKGGEMLLRDSLFEEDVIIFPRVASTSLRYGYLKISWQGCPQLGVWTKPGAGYICIEPWRGFSDPQNHSGELDQKPGMFVLEPGETERMAMTITIEATPATAG